MLPCPEGDWTSDSGDPVNKQVAELLRHYEKTHDRGLDENVREVLKACARALDPEGAQV